MTAVLAGLHTLLQSDSPAMAETWRPQRPTILKAVGETLVPAAEFAEG